MFYLVGITNSYELTRTEEKISNLSDYPEKYQLVEDPVLKTWGIRFVVVKNYLAFYTISEETKTVHIIRFLYGKRNWPVILRQSFPSIKY